MKRRPFPGTRVRRDSRQAGAMLMELTIAMTVLVVGVLGFLFAAQANFKATRDIGNRDLVAIALSNAAETIMEDTDFVNFYTKYNKSYVTPPTGSTGGTGKTDLGELVDSSGNPAQVLITFDVNETTLPVEYGPVTDLDGDGALATTDVSGSYVLLPMRLSLTYETAFGAETESMFIILGN